ncbi:uncharacterized protein LODBEIA_P61260 [Lodderomyces beijingensis]|uniref:Dihydrofolate reductase n=1 Tax=Lodderomyces beijingensis TaxID=1775926 RepID=A0ABP0ZW00_9ASCO
MKKPTVSVIVAALKPSFGIGNKGGLPWKLGKEMAYFKRVTTRTAQAGAINAVIMGRKTWDSIPPRFKPLPDRINVVLSRSFENRQVDERLIHANSIESALSFLSARPVEKVFIIGGAEIYNEVIKGHLVDYLLITEIEHVDDSPVEMDTFLEFDMHEWVKLPDGDLVDFTGEESVEKDINENGFIYNYTLWARK